MSFIADLAACPQQRDAAGFDVLVCAMRGRVDFDHSRAENVMIDVVPDLSWKAEQERL